MRWVFGGIKHSVMYCVTGNGFWLIQFIFISVCVQIYQVSYATSAVQLGVGGAFITDGRVQHALIKQVLGGDMTSAGGTFVTL